MGESLIVIDLWGLQLCQTASIPPEAGSESTLSSDWFVPLRACETILGYLLVLRVKKRLRINQTHRYYWTYSSVLISLSP